MHAEEVETAKMALGAGVDVLAHTMVDRRVDEELLRLAAESGVVLITGLAHFDRYRDVLDGAVSGNFMIRGFGTPIVPPVTEIPTLTPGLMALLALLLALGGALMLGRNPP